MDIASLLEQSGLTLKQAKLYLALLELGSSSVQKISQQANLPRSTCYEILEELKQRGFASSFKKKNVHWFSAADPKSLIVMEKQKLELLQKALPEMNGLYKSAGIRPNVRYYQGKQALRIILDEIVSEAKELLAFGSSEDLLGTFRDEWPEFIKKRVTAKIPSKVIAQDSPLTRQRQSVGPQELREVRLLPKNTYESRGMTLIWKNKIGLLTFKPGAGGFIIENEELAKIQTTMFYLIWNQLPPFRKI